MKYNVEFIKKILSEQIKESSRYRGICDIIYDHQESIMTECSARTITFIKSRFPSKQYNILYNSFGNAIGFERSRNGGYRFGSQEERIFFLSYLINELTLESEKKIELTFFQKVKQFLSKLIKWQ